MSFRPLKLTLRSCAVVDFALWVLSHAHTGSSYCLWSGGRVQEKQRRTRSSAPASLSLGPQPFWTARGCHRRPRPTGGRKSLPGAAEAVRLGRRLTGRQELRPGRCGQASVRPRELSAPPGGWAWGSELVHRKGPSGGGPCGEHPAPGAPATGS